MDVHVLIGVSWFKQYFISQFTWIKCKLKYQDLTVGSKLIAVISCNWGKLTLMHSGGPKLYAILAFLSALGLKSVNSENS